MPLKRAKFTASEVGRQCSRGPSDSGNLLFDGRIDRQQRSAYPTGDCSAIAHIRDLEPAAILSLLQQPDGLAGVDLVERAAIDRRLADIAAIRHCGGQA